MLGGGVAVPLLDESGGGVPDGLPLWSEGELGVEAEPDELESLGAAGAVVEESGLDELGAVDCCLEQAATSASALRQRRRALRFIVHLTVAVQAFSGRPLGPGRTQRLVAIGVPRATEYDLQTPQMDAKRCIAAWTSSRPRQAAPAMLALS